MGEKRLTNVSVLSADHKVANAINIDALIDKFASLRIWKLTIDIVKLVVPDVFQFCV